MRTSKKALKSSAPQLEMDSDMTPTIAIEKLPLSADNYRVLTGDCTELLKDIDTNTIDLTLSDIPYGISIADWDVLHNNTNSALGGQSPAQRVMGAGFKRRGKPINGWSRADLERPKEYQEWCAAWAQEVWRVMKPGGSILLFGGRRTIHRTILAMECAGLLLRDQLCWVKPSAHFRAQSLSKLLERRDMADKAPEWEGWRLGNLAPIFEPIAWFFKPYRIGGTIVDNVLEYGVGAMNADACLQDGKSPTNVLRFGFAKGEGGLHEAQKPVALLEYLIKLTTMQGQQILDPFMGSGSTGVACVNMRRKFIGMEQEPKHAKTSEKRIEQALQTHTLF